MALAGVSLNVLDGNLGLQPASNSQNMMVLGCSLGGSQGTLATFGDAQTLQSTLIGGEALELAAYILRTSGGVVQVYSLPPTTRGGVSAVTKVGTGAETLTVSLAPNVAITITCTTAGALGTAAFTFQLGSAAASQPVTSAASWSSTGYQVPGTYTTIVFTAGSYIAGGTPDIYTISTLGVVAHPQGAGPAVPTFTSSPVDAYTPKVSITTAGALGTMQFTYSLDGTAGSTSATIVSPVGGVYAIPSPNVSGQTTGIVLTFSGTSTAGDYFTFSAAPPTYANADMTAALNALASTYLSQIICPLGVFVGSVASASAWATQAGLIETGALSLFNLGVFMRFVLGGPTVGTVLPNAGSVTVDSADTNSVVITARQGMSAPHVSALAGDAPWASSVTGLTFRRNAAWAEAARAAGVEASQDVGAAAKGALVNFSGPAYFDDYSNGGIFDAAGITTFRSFGPGGALYLNKGYTATVSTSDYYPLTNARVIDRACGIVRLAAQRYVNAKLPTTTRNGLPGVITEAAAQKIEQFLTSQLRAALVDGSPQDAVAVSVVVSRTNNLLATSNLVLAVNVQPYGYAKNVTVNIGMVVNASL